MSSDKLLVKARVYGSTEPEKVIGFYYEAGGKPYILTKAGKGFQVDTDFIYRNTGLKVAGKLPLFETDCVEVPREDFEEVLSKHTEYATRFDQIHFNKFKVRLEYNYAKLRFEGEVTPYSETMPYKSLKFKVHGKTLVYLVSRPNAVIVN